MISKKQINVIGLGYIGLPTAAILANNGNSVNGVDINKVLLNNINDDKSNNLEPGLDLALKDAFASGNLITSTEPKSADIHIICVPTPLIGSESNPKPDLRFVFDVSKALIPYLKAHDIVIIESTIPVGTTCKVEQTLKSSGVDTDLLHFAHCPERVIPGRIMSELVDNDRIVGGLTVESTKMVADFYKTFVMGDVIETNAQTAELCKLSENSFRDLNIAFANELSVICENEGINAWELITLANRHPRVNILQPGVGVGGHCIAVDPWFIVSANSQNANLIQCARQTNLNKTDWVIDNIRTKLRSIAEKCIERPKVACLGAAFKPDVDDIRESPALSVIEKLIEDKWDVLVVEPNANENFALDVVDLRTAIAQADLIVILVSHHEFSKSDILEKMEKKTVLDFCGVTQQKF